ncbi:protein of unknown function [Shewanella benthica]|uniref:Uncharacterized protein n=1 Tax=Shewanella benthica TaxID=43661 RepID=A0A330MBB5_9GAMM|nr:protein of unknown function [Shewanella benthica]
MTVSSPKPIPAAICLSLIEGKRADESGIPYYQPSRAIYAQCMLGTTSSHSSRSG